MPHSDTPADRPTLSKAGRWLLLPGIIITISFALSLSAFIVHTHSVVATAHPRATTQYKVLFDNAHAETAGNADWVISTSQPDPLKENPNPQKETDWTGGISAWGVTLQRTGRYSLMTNTSALTYGDSSNPLDLSNFNALILPEPNTLFTASEKTAILTFVRNGGGLFMIADHNGSDRNNDGYDSLHIFNDLMNNNGIGTDLFGIQFDAVDIAKDDPHNDTPNPNPILQGPFGTATGSIIDAGTTETIKPADNPNVQGIIYITGASNTGTTGVFVASSLYGKGRIVAQGDSSAIDDGTCASGHTCYDGWDDPNGQNYILFPNATEWLAGGASSTPPPTPSPTAPSIPTATPTSIPTAVPTLSPTATPTSAPIPTPTVPPSPTPHPTLTPTPTPSPTSNLIVNGGFENGSSPWVEQSSGGYELIDPSLPHTGHYSAYLCGYNNCQDSIEQQITIPVGSAPAILTYYWYMSTQESSHPYDSLNVEILDSNGNLLTTLQTLTDSSQANTWSQARRDVSTYRGQTIEIAFVATTDSRKPTSFYIDDVALSA
jgi:hypothetical protein